MAGRVKTRLAAGIGDAAALAVYRKLIVHTRTQSSTANADKYLFYDQEIIQDEWPTDLYHKKLQSQGDLGDRMLHAFKHILESDHNETTKAIIIGSDCPDISTAIIEDALDRLELADVVIGPTLDGGYYLLGMKSVHSFLFQNVQWSTDKVYTTALKRLQDAGLLYSVMPTLSDLDNIDDLKKYPDLMTL